MTQRNQAGKDAGAGEGSVECIEKARLPDFGFSGHGEIGAWLSQRRLPNQKNGAPKIKFVSPLMLGDGLPEQQSQPKWLACTPE